MKAAGNKKPPCGGLGSVRLFGAVWGFWAFQGPETTKPAGGGLLGWGAETTAYSLYSGFYRMARGGDR